MTELQELIKRIREDRYFSFCAKCAQELDLRTFEHKVEDDFFVHLYECPPITPKYT